MRLHQVVNRPIIAKTILSTIVKNFLNEVNIIEQKYNYDFIQVII